MEEQNKILEEIRKKRDLLVPGKSNFLEEVTSLVYSVKSEVLGKEPELAYTEEGVPDTTSEIEEPQDDGVDITFSSLEQVLDESGEGMESETGVVGQETNPLIFVGGDSPGEIPVEVENATEFEPLISAEEDKRSFGEVVREYYLVAKQKAGSFFGNFKNKLSSSVEGFVKETSKFFDRISEGIAYFPRAEERSERVPEVVDVEDVVDVGFEETRRGFSLREKVLAGTLAIMAVGTIGYFSLRNSFKGEIAGKKPAVVSVEKNKGYSHKTSPVVPESSVNKNSVAKPVTGNTNQEKQEPKRNKVQRIVFEQEKAGKEVKAGKDEVKKEELKERKESGLERLVKIGEGLKIEAGRNKNYEYYTEIPTVMSSVVTKAVFDTEHEKEFAYKVLSNENASLKIKVLGYEKFEREGMPLVLEVKGEGSKDVVLAEVEEGIAILNLDAVQETLGNGKVYVALGNLAYAGHNNSTERDLLGIVRKATQVTSVHELFNYNKGQFVNNNESNGIGTSEKKVEVAELMPEEGLEIYGEELNELKERETAPIANGEPDIRGDELDYIIASSAVEGELEIEKGDLEYLRKVEKSREFETVYYRNSYFGKLSRKGKSREKIKEIENKIARDYIHSEKTVRELAEEIGVSSSTYSRYAREFTGAKSRREIKREKAELEDGVDSLEFLLEEERGRNRSEEESAEKQEYRAVAA